MQEWWVPLEGAPASAADSHVREHLNLSVHDHVAAALKTADCEPLPIDAGSSVGNHGTLNVVASVSLPHDRTIEQRFAAAIQQNRAHMQPSGAIDLVGADGALAWSFVPEELAASAQEAGTNRAFLITAYVSAVLIPVIGMLAALYAAVSGRTQAIRRHAIAIAGVALLAAGGYVLAITSILSANQDSAVAAHLRALLDANGVRYDSAGACYHQNGNQYVCRITENGQQLVVDVTDNGKTIHEYGEGGSGE